MTESPDGAGSTHTGRRVVLTIYVAVVILAGGMGSVVGLFLGGSLEPISILWLVDIPPSPLGFALYGAVTVAVGLGVPLLLVSLVSRRLDDPPAGR